MPETLEEKQAAARERSRKRRNLQNSKNATKPKMEKLPRRLRPRSIEKVLLGMASDPEVPAKQRIEAADRYCLLTGRPVLPRESTENDKDSESPKPEVARGSDLKIPVIESGKAVSLGN